MTHEKGLDHSRLELALQCILFLGLFVYAWQGIQTHLLYYGFGSFAAYPVFSWEESFLRTALTTPGGLFNALGALLAQSYRNDALGALVVAAGLGALILGMRRLLRVTQAGAFRDLAWIPPTLTLMIYNRYEDPLPLLLALGLALWLALLYASLPVKTVLVRGAVFLVFFALAYYLIGTSALVFAGLAFLTEALARRRIPFAVVLLALAGGLVFVLGRFAFRLEFESLLTAGTPWAPASASRFSPFSHILALTLWGYAPGLLIVVALGRVVLKAVAGLRSPGRQRNARAAAEPKKASSLPAWLPRPGLCLRPLAVALTAALCLTLSRSHIRYERALHYHAQQRDWDQVLALARRMRGRIPFTRSGVFDINRAMAHQGLLGSELCAYPQDGTKTLFLSFDDMTGRLQYAQQMELLLDLGCTNAAEKNVYELLDNEGPSPYILDAMVRIHLAKGEQESARIAFQALKKYAGSGVYIRRWQDVIRDPARAEVPTRLQSWRQARRTTDLAVMGVSFEPTLKQLLQDRPDNRLAFEYLMACYLLRHQRAQLVSSLPLLKTLNYRELPRHYAEALLVHALETRRPVEAFGWPIDPEVRTQFREMRAIVTNAHGDNQAAFNALASKYGDTYMFYSLFNVCGRN